MHDANVQVKSKYNAIVICILNSKPWDMPFFFVFWDVEKSNPCYFFDSSTTQGLKLIASFPIPVPNLDNSRVPSNWEWLSWRMRLCCSWELYTWKLYKGKCEAIFTLSHWGCCPFQSDCQRLRGLPNFQFGGPARRNLYLAFQSQSRSANNL